MREPPDVPLFSGDAYDVSAPVLLTIGNDCAVGKMSVSLELVAAACDAGVRARFVPTGQTGILIAGWGISVDRVIADFAPGAAEQLVLYAAHEGAELIVVEGQGAINHPAYAPVTLALMTGCAPDGLILVCDPQRVTIESYPTPILDYAELIALHEALLAAVKPAPVIGIALNTRGMSDAQAREAIERARSETGLPADDVVRFGGARLYNEVRPSIVKRAPRTSTRGRVTAHRLVVALLCAVAVFGCSRPAQPARGGLHNAWTVPGVLRLGEDEEPDGLNLMYAHTAAADTIAGMLFTFILRYDARGNYVPDLATEVPTPNNGGISADGKRIVVHLRRDAVWADGAPLTAADWLFTYRAVMNPANAVKTRYGWDQIANASAPDPHTIVIRLRRANVAVLGILGMGGAAYPPLPAHLLMRLPNLDRAAFNQQPLSSGPYLLKAWNHGSSLVFVPNPRYFRGAPKLKEVVWKVIPDVNTLFNQLATHEVDVYPNVNENSIGRLSEISGIRVLAI